MLPLGGHPLIAHSVRKAITSDLFDVVCVSTEDQEIATIASSYGADVPFIRPDYLARDPATIEDVMLHALDYYNSEGIIFHELSVILPTTPFVTVQDLLKAQEFFRASGADALLSVTPTDFPPFNAWLIHHEEDYQRLTPCFPESPYKFVKSTECPTTYRSNGAIIIVNVPAFLASKDYRKLTIVPFVMPQERSLDIDTEFEYNLAQSLWNNSAFKMQGDLFL
jgi:CMP-N-acetylneuraminic acid synthetase